MFVEIRSKWVMQHAKIVLQRVEVAVEMHLEWNVFGN